MAETAIDSGIGSQPKKKVTLTTSASIRVNTGSYESVDVFKSMQCEVEFGSKDELSKKSAMIDETLVGLLQREAEVLMARIGRTRKLDGEQIGLWHDATRDLK